MSALACHRRTTTHATLLGAAVLLAVAMLAGALPAPAAAAPPEPSAGGMPPAEARQTTQLTYITRDYRGPATISRSGPNCVDLDDVDAEVFCPTVVRPTVFTYRRAFGRWIVDVEPREQLRTVFFVAPFIRNWHWAWSPSGPMRIIPTIELDRWAPRT